MTLSARQQTLVRKHAKWLSEEYCESIYNRTTELARKYEPKGNPTKWLLFVANNVYIYEYCRPGGK